MSQSAQNPTMGLKPLTRDRQAIETRYKWRLEDIYPGWDAWQADLGRVRERMDRFVALKGTLGQGPQAVLAAHVLSDDISMMAYKLYRFPQLMYDVDQRDNQIQARLQEVQHVFAEFGVRSAWFTPELLSIDEATMMGWVEATEGLHPYRFPIAETYRNQQHVLDERGEELLSFGSRFRQSPNEVYRALSTADVTYNTIALSDGTTTTISPGEYQRLLHTSRSQEDRRRAFEAMYGVFASNKNTYAALYNAICQRDWSQAQARNFGSTAEAALFGDAVPVEVLENLIATARKGAAPLQRYHRLRAKALDLGSYHLYDSFVPLVSFEKQYPYDSVTELIIESVAPLGTAYQSRMREAMGEGWIDVYENDGKRSGAYSAGVYGVHPYMLLNYADTLNDVFTLAHELGHTLHTVLSNEHQPFATSGYTIFVAEVASTTNEALLLDLMLARTEDPLERAYLLQHAISGITGTFYAQVLFADYELQAHRMAERGEPITGEALSKLYYGLLQAYYGDSVDLDQLYELTWARIPHFFNSPYYVYQYATCYASSARLVEKMLGPDPAERQATVERYLALLQSGGNDQPMLQLQRAGIDLSQNDTVEAVVEQLDRLVAQLEAELARL